MHGKTSDPGGYRPGNRVRVILGNVAALRGRVLNLFQAHTLLHESGLPSNCFSHLPGQVCVAVRLLGVCIPMAFDLDQVRLDPFG